MQQASATYNNNNIVPRSDSDPYALMQTVNSESSQHDDDDEQYKEVFVWGNDMRGQLGINSRAGKSYSLPKLVCFHTVIRQVSCGEDHAALITNQGYLYTMGSNQDGKLGIGSSRVLSANVPTLVQSLDTVQLLQVSCGWTHTAAISIDGNAYAWGLSQQGALGLGKIQQRAVHQPILITFFQRHQIKVQQVSCGSMHTGFVTSSNQLYVCGNGNQGQLGLGKNTREFLPKHVTRTLEPVVRVACGIFHTCYVTDKGQVYGMGGNNFGQLGNGGKKNSLAPVLAKGFSGKRVVDISCGHHSGAITDQGELYIWGTGVFGQYLTPQKFSPANEEQGNQKFVQVSIGGTFGGVTCENGTVWSWGMNQSGQLGVGDSNPRMCPVLVQSISHKRVSQISCGGSFAVATGQVVLSSSQKQNAMQSSYSGPIAASSGLNTSNFPPPPHSIGFQSKTGANSQLNISSDQNNSTPVIGQRKQKLGKNSSRSAKRKQSSSRKPRNFGEDLKNKTSSDRLRSSSNNPRSSNANYPSGRSGGIMHIDDPVQDGTTKSYINLLKQQKEKLEDQLHYEKVERIKSENQVRDLFQRLEHGEHPGWQDQLRQRIRQLEKDNNSAKYALIEQRNRNGNLEDQNKKLLNAMNDQLSFMQSRNDAKTTEKFANSQNLLNSELHRQNQGLRMQIQRLQDDLLSQSRSNHDLQRRVDQLTRRLDQLDDSNRHLEQKSRQIQNIHQRDISSKARREKQRTLDAIQLGNSHILLQERRKSYNITTTTTNQQPPSPPALSNSIYAKGPSYKQRRLQSSTEKWQYQSKKSGRRCTPRKPNQAKFSDISPDVRREREQLSPGNEVMNLRKSQRSPMKSSIVARSPQREPSLPSSPSQKPKLSPIIKDDLVGSKPIWKKTIINPKYDEPKREPCGFTKAPTINVISPSKLQQKLVDQTPKFHSRENSQVPEYGNERGRQMNSYKEKLLRDLQRSVGSPFGGVVPSFKKPAIRQSDYKYHIQKENTEQLLDRSSEKLLQLTKSPLRKSSDKGEEQHHEPEDNSYSDISPNQLQFSQ